MTDVLFTQKGSIYQTLNCNCYDIKKDARTYPGGIAIHHPPCGPWGNYSKKSMHTQSEKDLAIWSINKVRLFGGVVEHPASSKIWSEMSIGPGYDKYGGFILSIDQYWFGHQSKKPTYLYIVGLKHSEIPDYPIQLPYHYRSLEDLSKKQRASTPVALANYLIQLIKKIKEVHHG